jgi:hypothetical protein
MDNGYSEHSDGHGYNLHGCHYGYNRQSGPGVQNNAMACCGKHYLPGDYWQKT